MNAKDILRNVETILVVDWPSKEVPELLALAGFQVVVHGGPGLEDYSAYEVNDGKVTARRVGRPRVTSKNGTDCSHQSWFCPARNFRRGCASSSMRRV